MEGGERRIVEMDHTAFAMHLRLCLFLCMLYAISPLLARNDEPVQHWKNEIVYHDDPFCSRTSPAYIKFTIIIREVFDPNIVYYQDSRKYTYHYDFAAECLDLFMGMSLSEYDSITLYEQRQQAILGAVILSPRQEPPFNEYGIQFVRYDPYTKEQIVQMFNIVKASVIADPNVQAFYFPTYEQFPTAQQNRDWFESQGVPVGSTAQWAEGNTSYSDGWALGPLKFFPSSQIQTAYTAGNLLPGDILLTDAVPSEIPSVAGIVTLMPSTPNSHVAILAQSQGVPFVHLFLEPDVVRVEQLVGRIVYLAVTTESWDRWCNVKLLDVEMLDEQDKSAILALKQTPQLTIQPILHKGQFSAEANDLYPSDIAYFGGKASNFGILRRTIPENSPPAMAFSFDLWSAFLGQPLSSAAPITVAPGQYILFWADGDVEQGPNHTSFKLSRFGEDLGLYDIDGTTLIDGLSYGPQTDDVSYGRTVDGAGQWQFLDSPSPGTANSAYSSNNGLVINEFMADNETTIEDPNEPGEHPDWLELYNGSDSAVVINGMYLTDDFDEPTKWQIPVAVSGTTLREEVASRLSKYTTYPPSDMKAISADLAAIRNIFRNPHITTFSPQLQDAVIDALQGFGFDPNSKIRFRSSTNVEDSEQFTGAGLYDSYSGCLADDLDDDDVGPCACDSSVGSERGVFRAIRKVFASFYNDNAFLERLKHGINEADVGMALLVHHSFPDDIELANGVATMERGGGFGWNVNLTCQKGAVSVTNPPKDAVPELVRIDAGFGGVRPWLIQRSSLVPLRQDTVMQWEDDYVDLYGLLLEAGERYSQLKEKDDLLLDFEFKKVAPDGKLIVKQLREIPRPGNAQYPTPFLLAEPRQYWSLQGRGGNVFTNHRLKSRWTLSTRNVWLTRENLQQCLYTDVEIEYVADGRIEKVSGEMATLPDFGHTYEEPQTEFDNPSTVDSWRFFNLSNPRSYRLRTQPLFPTTVPDPVVTQDDMRLVVEVEYEKPVPLDEVETTTTDTITLYTPWQPNDAQAYMGECSFDDPNGVSIRTQFYVQWQLPGILAPTSVQLDQTRIEGLTTEPIVLTGYFSQSVGAGAHLCPMRFLFEPQLEPGISQQILDELRAKDIRLIYFGTGARDCRPTEWEDTGPTIRTYGFDD
ncbi:hypothetical protein ES703_25756 [subsurface metagenome]